MDSVVIPAGPDLWRLEDPLGRPLGTIRLVVKRFTIDPDPNKLPDINTGPHDTLDLALAAVERVTRGACQFASGM